MEVQLVRAARARCGAPPAQRERVSAGEKRGREIPAIALAMDVEYLRSVLDQLPPEVVDRLRRGPLGPELGLRAPGDSLEKQEGR
jgi:hypothetical protein